MIGQSVLFDASAIFPIFVPEKQTKTIRHFIASRSPEIVLSDFAAGEFSSIVSRHVRTKQLELLNAHKVLGLFDGWRISDARNIVVERSDLIAADSLVRRFDLQLRFPDALYLAKAQRLGLALLTFDHDQANAARLLGIALIDPEKAV